MTQLKKHIRRNRKQGLILLIVLGMLAMFTLLAVAYVVTAGTSRTGSLALAVKARNSNLSITGTARSVVKDVLRGTNNQKSPFYKMSLIEDVFGPNPIRTQFGPFRSATNSARRFYVQNTGVNLVKLSISRAAQLNGPLSDYENEYNSRILTILEGPLAGQSFRILKYVGFVRGGFQSGAVAPDPNMDQTPWSNQSYADSLASDLEYSVLIDLNEVVGSEFPGEYMDTNGTIKSVSLSLNKWISTFGITSLFYFQSTTTSSTLGYKLLINDAPFNSPGIGLEDIAINGVVSPSTPLGVVPSYGNMDGQRLLNTNRKVPLALLTHYDYLQDANLMAVNPADGTRGVDGIGNTTRDWTQPTAFAQFALQGASNEGYDVPGFQDPWLAHQSFAGGQFTVKPSYHDPAVVNYISNLYGNPSSMSAAQVNEMLRLIDASSARVLSYLGKNTGFRENDLSVVRLPQTFTWTTPTPAEILSLQSFVRNQIMGSWDVDNDGDGIADSVWIDPGMQVVFAPDGRRLRPLAAILIEDLDGRVNLNTAGDRGQGNAGFDAQTNAFYKRPNQIVPQGFGNGPAEISLTRLFQPNSAAASPLLFSDASHFSFFDELAGARRYSFRPINYALVNDRVPGIPRPVAYPDPSFSALSEREFHLATQHNRLPGMPVGRRGTFGMSYDRLGNPAFVNPQVVDGDPYNAGANAFADETRNDKYESAAMDNPIADDPLGLHDLETILRRFDEDAASLPPRLRDKLTQIPGYSIMDGINREITVRSGELRYPNLATAMKTVVPRNLPPPSAVELTIAGGGIQRALGELAPEKATPSYLRYIQMLHSQRYRNQTFPPAATDDPMISYAALAELFPVDFAKGLRMDLNRPFGNGYDDDLDGQVDEPQELVAVDKETYPATGYTLTDGAYTREVKPDARKLNAQIVDPNVNANAFTSQTRNRLGSRQILARNLYCLAQLIIPRDFVFPGMEATRIPAPTGLQRARIRATAIAQWAVNVVDFRDADAAMTRFEFDILPFGSNAGPAANFGTGAPGGLPAKLAYWAPDRIQHNSNKQFVGVVWGMEMPELLLTETLATHDTRLRDTDMDTTQKSTTDTPADDDLDQFRFPLASLFLELYNPRTTDAATNALIPGVPSSLYNTATMALDLGRLAPPSLVHPFTPTTPLTATSPTWGQQPVWRIALSEMYPASSTDHPQAKLTATTSTARTFETLTHQWSTEQVSGGPVSEKVLSGATNLDHTNTNLQYIEQYIGTGLHYDLANQSTAPPAGFERFIWLSNTRPTQYQLIPDILPTIRTAGHERESVYTASTAGASLAGGSYLVLGPRAQTSFGSLTHNQFSGYDYTSQPILKSADMGTAANRPILSHSFQKIDLTAGSVDTYLLNNVSANQPWLSRIKTRQSLICTTPSPTTGGWASAFTGGIGINISMPPPVDDQTIWLSPAHVPDRQLNTSDTTGGPRTDGSDGFGSPIMPPDSWIDVSGGALNRLPDTPIDYSNPMLAGRLNTGTYENVRAAYLQRLADPDFPFDPVTNPYITVDWMSIDLTVFNGEARMGSDPKDTPIAVKFQSRYKNGALSPLATPHNVLADKGISYYSPMTGNLRTTAPQTSVPSIAITGTPSVNPESYFMYQLGYDKQAYAGNIGNSASTFGYCNAGYFFDAANPSSLPTAAQMAQTTNTTTGQPVVAWQLFDGFGPPIDATVQAYKGAPARLAGVTWFNRPFASPHELMMVPLTGPSLFGLHHSALTAVQNREMNSFVPSYQTTNAWNVDLRHDVVPTPPSPPLPPTGQPSVQSYWAKPEPLTAGTRLADWPLLLEFVETQPPFIDANKFYRPDTMLALSQTDSLAARFLNSFLPAGYTIPEIGAPTSLAGSEPYTVRGSSLLAPYNIKPSYVAAGKINLNTIAFDSNGHSRALKAIEHNYLAGERSNPFSSAAFEASFATSRQGYAIATPNNFFTNSAGVPQVVHPAMDPNFPTRFVGAYRPAMSSNLAPALATKPANEKMRSRYGVESTLLRSLDPATNTVDMGPLQSIAADRPMLFDATPVADELKATQPFVRMQRAMRLPNLVTNQSNVFAVWVTVSLYEYDPISGFGNEYIGDTGLPERERQFFIVDRTIPVGFKPGEDLNTDRTILMQRKLP